MAKRTKNDQQATRACVEVEMSKLTPQEKIAYCATKRVECFLAQNKAQEILTRADREAQRACVHSALVAFGMCVPMMGLYVTTGIPAEVGYVFGSGMATCVGYGAVSCILKSIAHNQVASQLSILETTKNTAISVCDNSPEVQEYKDSVLAEFGVSQQSK